MTKLPKYLSEKRIAVEPPERLVSMGQAKFGTFNAPIPNLNVIECGKKSKFTEWEAFEISFDEGLIVSAVYNNMYLMGFNIIVFFDKRTGKVSRWLNYKIPYSNKQIKVAPNLIMTKTEGMRKNSHITMVNNFEKGEVYGKAWATNKKYGTIEFDMKAKSLSDSCVVSIPFGPNMPLYSQKEFMKGEGTVTVNGEVFKSNENTTVIVDDHKGFYPHKAHYDWLTTMGMTEIDGKQQYLAINFTRNQSTDQDAYNENILWLDGKSFILPPVNFTYPKCGKHPAGTVWQVKDDHGTVDVTFEIINTYEMPKVKLGFMKIDYNLPFGKLKGFVKDYDGKVYNLDGMYGIGEDKSTIL